ncbi:hypothetical protein [Streptomyces sp. NPDC050416]|uniref:hypothetical protein n=1 Tax=Streptomyces sp. NPDC050416 TaxID=3365611 RepID=UPI003798413F
MAGAGRPAVAVAGAGRPAGAVAGAARDASAVTDWMRTAGATIKAETHAPPPELFIWEAYVSTAVYKAVVGIEGRFAPYKWDGRAPRTASSAAAAASAAHQVLRHHFPKAAPRLDAALAGTLAEIPDGEAEDEGVAFGKLAAEHIVELRRDDGRGASVPFPARPRPGVWRPTPPGHEPFASAWVGRVRPLLLDSPHQFRPGPPPPLRSARYARDLHELALYGGRTGSHRSPQQTDTASTSSPWTCKAPSPTTPPGTGSTSPRRHACTRRPTRPGPTPSSPPGTPNSTTAPGGPSPPSGRRTPTATPRPGRTRTGSRC